MHWVVESTREFPKVDILYSYVEPNVAMIQALQTSGVKGIVSVLVPEAYRIWNGMP